MTRLTWPRMRETGDTNGAMHDAAVEQTARSLTPPDEDPIDDPRTRRCVLLRRAREWMAASHVNLAGLQREVESGTRRAFLLERACEWLAAAQPRVARLLREIEQELPSEPSDAVGAADHPVGTAAARK